MCQIVVAGDSDVVEEVVVVVAVEVVEVEVADVDVDADVVRVGTSCPPQKSGYSLACKTARVWAHTKS